MKRFLVLSVVSLMLLVSVAKCEGEEEPETDVAEDDLEELDLGDGGNSTTSRPKRQDYPNYDIYSGGGGMMGGGDPSASYAMMGGAPGGGMAPMAAIGGMPGGGIGGPIGGIGGPIGGIGGYWPWDPCQPPWGCPRCPQLYIWHSQNCQQFCFSRKWCLCQWW